MNYEKTNQDKISCLNCGSVLHYIPGTTHLACDFCKSENKIEAEDAALEGINEKSDFWGFVNSEENNATKQIISTISCENCGAETTTAPNIITSTCGFCDSPLVASNSRLKQKIIPKGILPFIINEKEAQDRFNHWVKKLILVPSGLKKSIKDKKVKGIYLPIWAYDVDTHTNYVGSVSLNQGNQEYRKPKGGRVTRKFQNRTVRASQSLSEQQLSSLYPWDYQNIVPFDTSYLSGLESEIHQINVEDGYKRAKELMQPVIYNDIKEDMNEGYKRAVRKKTTTFSKAKFKLLMIPLWVVSYKFNDEVYHFIVNGRTGKLKKEKPSSNKLFWIVIGIIALYFGIVALRIFFNF